MDKSGPVYTKAKIMVKYVMGCAISMQLHSHGLVKHVIEIQNQKKTITSPKNDIKLLK